MAKQFDMQDFLLNIQIKVNENIYLKDPESSDLGKKIVSGSISLIHEIGIDSFTFKKLATKIKSTEASVYRYFENKHKLLLYLCSWYWGWLTYRVMFRTTNIEDPCARLKNAIKTVVEQVEEDNSFSHINEVLLNKIVITEGSKAYLNSRVDEENELGIFTQYKELVERISAIILEIKPNFLYSHMLVSTIIEGSHFQRYFAEHLPRLTDVIEGEDSIENFYIDLALKAIK